MVSSVRQIILFIFGGVSEIPEETRDFRKEFKIAIAGLMHTSFAIACFLRYLGGLYLKLVLQNSSYWPQNKSLKEFYCMALLSTPCLEDQFDTCVSTRWWKNIVQALLHGRRTMTVLQGFKLESGYIYGFMGVGFLAMITGSFISGIWILLIGWFLNMGAQSYLSQHELTRCAGDTAKRHYEYRSL